MSKFNSKATGTATINRAGGHAFKQSDKLALASMLMCTLLNGEDKAYQSEKSIISKIKEKFNSIEDKKFLAKATIYARDKFRMRSVSHVCSALIAENVHGEEWLKNYYKKVTLRPDDMLETLAYYWGGEKRNKPIPNAMKKGYASVLEDMDTYQYKKYMSSNKGINLLDVVRLVRPKTTERNSEALKSLINGTLSNDVTWNAKLSSGLSNSSEKSDEEKAQIKKDVWKDFVSQDPKKIEAFALLRNLRNIIKTEDDEVISRALSLVTNPDIIHRSRILPFRYVVAYATFEDDNDNVVDRYNRQVLEALSRALTISLDNVPKFSGRTAILIDTSGSMSGKPIVNASVFGATLFKASNADIITFANSATLRRFDPTSSVISIAKEIVRHCGGGTDFTSAIREFGSRKYDRVIILSDMQSWADNGRYIGWGEVPVNEAFKEYRRKVNPECKLYSFDLQGYGDMQFPERNVNCLAGFSEKVFDLMSQMEDGFATLIDEIEKISL